MCSCTFTSAAAGETGFGANVDSSAKESAGSDDDRPCTEASSFEGLDAEYSCLILGKQKPRDGTLHGAQVSTLFEEGPHRAPVKAAITLRTRCPYRRTLAPIKHAELDRSEISSFSHYSAKRIHLAHDGSLRNPANRRVARHLADCLERARDEPYSRTQASTREPSLAAATAASVPA